MVFTLSPLFNLFTLNMCSNSGVHTFTIKEIYSKFSMLRLGLAAFLHLRCPYNFHLLPLFFQVSVTCHCLEALGHVQCIPVFLCSHIHFQLTNWLCSICQHIWGVLFRIGSQACSEEVVYSRTASDAFCGSHLYVVGTVKMWVILCNLNYAFRVCLLSGFEIFSLLKLLCWN